MLTGLSPTNQRILDSISSTQADLNKAQRQISSGLRVSRASDDPSIIADIFATRADLARVTQLATNLNAVKSEADLADVGLQTAVQLLETAGSMAVQGNGPSMTPGGRQTLATQIDGILQQIVTISRSEVHGAFLFSGDQTSTPPYEVDTNPSSLTGVTQLATAPATRLIQDQSGTTFAVSKTAREIFDARDGNGDIVPENVFAALVGLKNALLANDPDAIHAAGQTINKAHDYLNDQAAFYGAVQNRISTALDLAQKFQIQDQTRLSTEQDADVAKAAIQMTQDTTAMNATLASAAKQITTTLFDLMK